MILSLYMLLECDDLRRSYDRSPYCPFAWFPDQMLSCRHDLHDLFSTLQEVSQQQRNMPLLVTICPTSWDIALHIIKTFKRSMDRAWYREWRSICQCWLLLFILAFSCIRESRQVSTTLPICLLLTWSSHSLLMVLQHCVNNSAMGGQRISGYTAYIIHQYLKSVSARLVQSFYRFATWVRYWLWIWNMIMFRLFQVPTIFPLPWIYPVNMTRVFNDYL